LEAFEGVEDEVEPELELGRVVVSRLRRRPPSITPTARWWRLSASRVGTAHRRMDISQSTSPGDARADRRPALVMTFVTLIPALILYHALAGADPTRSSRQSRVAAASPLA
jgi:hypothetical protein